MLFRFSLVNKYIINHLWPVIAQWMLGIFLTAVQLLSVILRWELKVKHQTKTNMKPCLAVLGQANPLSLVQDGREEETVWEREKARAEPAPARVRPPGHQEKQRSRPAASWPGGESSGQSEEKPEGLGGGKSLRWRHQECRSRLWRGKRRGKHKETRKGE